MTTGRAWSIWLAGVALVIPLCAASVMKLEPGLRDDLKARASATLTASAHGGWAGIDVAGRDVIVSGSWQDQQQRQAVLDILQSIPGPRRIEDRTAPKPTGPITMQANAAGGTISVQGPFYWSAIRVGAEVRLVGEIPPGAARQRLLAEISAALPSVVITDRMTEVPTAPAVMPELLRTAVGHLRRLDSGTVQITGTSYAIRGTVASPAAQSDILKEIEALPAPASMGPIEITIDGDRRGQLGIEPVVRETLHALQWTERVVAT